MKITVSQQNKKINIIFKDKNLEKNFIVTKSDEFLECVSMLVKKNKINLKAFKSVQLEFPAHYMGEARPQSGRQNTGLLTERIIRVIILGLSF